MSILRRRTSIGSRDSGIFLTVLTGQHFKTNSFIVHFMTKLTGEDAAANAAVSFLLEDSCREYPDLTSFNLQLSRLYGASLHGGVSYFCDNQTVTLSASCIADPYALEGEEISYELLRLLCGCIFEPPTENGIFPEKQFQLKKQELLDDIDADINDKRSYAIKQARGIIYAGESAGLPVKGERSAAAALTAQQVYSAYQKLLRSARIEIFFVGTSLPGKCEQLLTDRFSAIARQDVFLPVNLPSPIKETPRYVNERLDVVQSKMVMAFKYECREKNMPVAMLFNHIFGATPFSMLFKNVRERLSLCYYCSSSVNWDKRAVFVDSGVEDRNIDAAREEILRQLERIGSGDISDELIGQSKLYIINGLRGVGDSARSAADWYFDLCLDREEDTISPEQYIEDIRSVAKEDICTFARSLVLDTVYVLTGREEQK